MFGRILKALRKKYSTLSLAVGIPSQVQTIGAWEGQFGALWALTHASPCSPRDSQESSPTPQFKSINSLVLNFIV